MDKSILFTAVLAAVSLTSNVAWAEADDSMEKCTVVKDGKSLIKAHKGDCKGTNHSCAGQNAAGEADSWIIVPKGDCSKINSGDYTGMSPSIRDKVEGAS
jgi:uncharacterized membrane protein